MGNFRSIPRELEDKTHGGLGPPGPERCCGSSVPWPSRGALTIVLLGFTLSWGNLIHPLAFTASTPPKVLAVGLATELVPGDIFCRGALMAGALPASVPAVLAYSFCTKYFVSGRTAGATKG